MTNPITDHNRYLAEVTAIANGLLAANNMRGAIHSCEVLMASLFDWEKQAQMPRRMRLAVLYLAYDHSPMLASALGWARESTRTSTL
jgi:hypothetical protein